MKRVGYIYEQIVSIENCKMAILNASDGKRDRYSVRIVLEDIDRYSEELSSRLKALDFTTPYLIRIVKDGLSKKERELKIPAFYPDQCAHHAVVQVIMPIILKSSYYWSCANIRQRGIDRACRGVERATIKDMKHAKYCVKLDIKKFYPSIPHDRLKERFKQKIKDNKALQIIFHIIDTAEGVPIGNYTSPWFAELYLQPLDHYIKEQLHVKHYIRYADDMVIIGNNKRKLMRVLHSVKAFVESLGLTLKDNYQLFKILGRHNGRKIDFVGRCFARGYTTIRKRRALAFMRQSRRIQKLQSRNIPVSFRVAAGFLSRSNCLKHTKSLGLKKKYYDTVDIENLKEVIRHESQRQRYSAAAAY